MESYFRIKPMTNDCFNWIRFFTITVFYNRFFRLIRIFTLIFHLTITFVNIYFFITVFKTEFLYRFSSSFLVVLSSIIINATFLFWENDLKALHGKIWPAFWALDSTTEETERKLLAQTKHRSCVVAFNCILVIFTGFIMMPVGQEQDYKFSLFFFRTYLTSFHYVLDTIYFLTIPVTSFMTVSITNLVTYYGYHSVVQIQLSMTEVFHVCGGYEDYDDDSLVNNPEYQNVVKRRLKFMVERHNDLYHCMRIVMNLTTVTIPWFALALITMCLSALSYAFFVQADVYWWRNFQLFMWFTSSTLTGCLLVHCGQEIEDTTTSLTSDAVVNTRLFTTCNKSTVKIALIMLTVGQNPCKIKFTQTMSLNYDIGLRVVRSLYSFACIFAHVQNI